MVKFTAILITVTSLLVSVQAACPTNGHFCGSELLDVYKCTTREHLEFLTPPSDAVNTDIYPTDSDGIPQNASASCKQTGCRNSNIDVNPPQYASCF